MKWQYLGAMFLALLLSLIITPVVKKLAIRWGVLDKPDHRKVHQKLMPRMGGLAIFISFITVVLLTQPLNKLILGMIVGSTWIVGIGIIDDFKGLSPKVKLGGQIIGALILIAFGFRVDFITNPFSEGMLLLGKLAIPITILWIIGVTNAVNLIDGLDGLAAGTSGIAALTMVLVVLSQFTIHPELAGGSLMIIPLALILLGSLLGFLKYNFHPAQIFMGDSGSMFLGFTLSALAITGLTKGAAVISVFIPIVILGIPIFDTCFAILRRFLNKQPIFQPDKNHLHHCLLERGLSHKQTVLAIYGINLVLGASAVLMTWLDNAHAMVLLGIIAFLVILGANRLGITDRKMVLDTKNQAQNNTLSQ